MSDTKECCVCYEATEHSTPCEHLVCESCYSQVPTCPMCRAPLEEDSDFDIDEANQEIFEVVFFGHLDSVRLMLFRGANNYNTRLMTAAWRGHLDIVLQMLQQGADDFNGAMSCAALCGHEDIVKLVLFKGANNYNTRLTNAVSGGNMKVLFD